MAVRGSDKSGLLTFAAILRQQTSIKNQKTPESFKKEGKLILVTTPIGEYADITINALNKLNSSDYIICEEFREAKRLLKFFNIEKELFTLNEHNQYESNEKFIQDILNGKVIALISDCGTPGFADPGIFLIKDAIKMNLKIDFINGSNSVLSAVTSCGFDISRFYFVGFLSQKKEIRRKEFVSLKTFEFPFVIMDTPYRLKNILEDLCKHFSASEISLAMNLTTESETIFYGKPAMVMEEIENRFGVSKIIAEFVIVVKA